MVSAISPADALLLEALLRHLGELRRHPGGEAEREEIDRIVEGFERIRAFETEELTQSNQEFLDITYEMFYDAYSRLLWRLDHWGAPAG